MWTVPTLEEELVLEVGPYMSLVGMNATATPDGTNVNIRAAIRRAVVSCGGTIAQYPFVTDADLASVTQGPERVALIAILNVLKTIWGHWAKFDQRDGDTDQKLSQVADRLEKRIKAIEESLLNPETAGGVIILPSAPEIGVIKAGTERPMHLGRAWP